jgi:hypothetical protein
MFAGVFSTRLQTRYGSCIFPSWKVKPRMVQPNSWRARPLHPLQTSYLSRSNSLVSNKSRGELRRALECSPVQGNTPLGGSQSQPWRPPPPSPRLRCPWICTPVTATVSSPRCAATSPPPPARTADSSSSRSPPLQSLLFFFAFCSGGG